MISKIFFNALVVAAGNDARQSCASNTQTCKADMTSDDAALLQADVRKHTKATNPDEGSALAAFEEWYEGKWCPSKYGEEIYPEEALAQACLDDPDCQGIWWVPGWNAGKKCAEASFAGTHYSDQKVAAKRHGTSSTAVYPHDLMKCPNGAVLKTEHMEPSDYDAIIADFKTAFDALPRVCEGMNCPVADVCGCILRMAGHDFMDYKEGVGGGSDACTDMAEADNAGLKDCLVTGLEGATISQVYETYCEKVSLADFVVIAAEAAMTYTRQLYLDATSEDRGHIDFRTQFEYGRTTSTQCTANQHLPDPSKSCRDVERVFIDNMGLDWKGATALMGVHTLGRAQLTNSGFYGWWSDAKNSRRFNNDYYISLLLKGWTPEQVATGKWQWAQSDLARDEAKDGHQMMLDSDFCLAWSDGEGEDYKEITAASEATTCAWTIPNITYHEGRQSPLFDAMDKYNDGKFCGIVLEDNLRDLPGGADVSDRSAQWKTTGWYYQKYQKKAVVAFKELRAACCNGCKNFKEDCWELNLKDGMGAAGTGAVYKDTGAVTHPAGKAIQYVIEFANDELLWIAAFLEAWATATTNGFDNLTRLTDV